jgi:hypothetical protein
MPEVGKHRLSGEKALVDSRSRTVGRRQRYDGYSQEQTFDANRTRPPAVGLKTGHSDWRKPGIRPPPNRHPVGAAQNYFCPELSG